MAVSFLAQISVLFLISAFWHGARASGKVLLNNGMPRK